MASESASPPAKDDATDAPVAAESAVRTEQPAVPRLRASRRRTKTGCLTCRKRRIKCGEERPICNNCIKSKRHCEGYNQRVVFKPPTDFRAAGGGNTIPFHTGSLPGTARNLSQNPVLPVAQGYPLTPLLPRGSDPQDYGVLGDPLSATSGHNHILGTFFAYGTPQNEQIPQQAPHSEQYPQSSESYGQSSVQAQFPASGHPPPTPLSASLHGQPTFDYNQYGVYSTPIVTQEPAPTTAAHPTPETPFSMPSQNLPLEQRSIRPEWQMNIFDGQIGHQQQPSQHQPMPPPQTYPQGYSHLSTPATPSQGMVNFHTPFPYLCVGNTGGNYFPERLKFEQAIA